MTPVSIKRRVDEAGSYSWVGSIEGLDIEYTGESPEEVAETLVQDVDMVLDILRATVAPNIDLAGRIVQAFADHVGECLEECNSKVDQDDPTLETLKISR